jgi:MoxR-like ATPase
MEGTFPLPEPEIDRFFFKLVVAPPTCEEIDAILERTTEGEPTEVRTIVDGKRLLEMRAVGHAVSLSEKLRRAAATLVAATHPQFAKAPEMVRRFVRYGASPRGGQALVLGAKIRAAAAGRHEVAAEDLVAMAVPALRHRLILNFEGQSENISADTLVQAVLASLGKA